MKIAITGGTGFVGRHLARRLADHGHDVVLVSRGLDRRDPGVFSLPRARFFAIGTSDEEKLSEAFAGCDAVAHCAGINREAGLQTYERVHIQGTQNVVRAAERARAKKLLLVSFLRARPRCGSPYHESKWAAEEIVRASRLDFTILKPGIIYGRGDHLLDHLSRALHTFPIFALLRGRNAPVRPLAVEDLTAIIEASLVEGRLSRKTVGVTGPEELPFSQVVRRVGGVLGRRVRILPLPLSAHYFLAWWFERLMTIPLISLAQVRILAEGLVEPLPACDSLPEGLRPKTVFSEQQIRQGLPSPEPFGWGDCRSFFLAHPKAKHEAEQ